MKTTGVVFKEPLETSFHERFSRAVFLNCGQCLLPERESGALLAMPLSSTSISASNPGIEPLYQGHIGEIRRSGHAGGCRRNRTISGRTQRPPSASMSRDNVHPLCASPVPGRERERGWILPGFETGGSHVLECLCRGLPFPDRCRSREKDRPRGAAHGKRSRESGRIRGTGRPLFCGGARGGNGPQ